MKGMDRFLWAIVIGALLLVALGFVVVLGQQDASYREGNNPEDIAHNYLLALVNEDYERAYSYLSPEIEGYPASVADFRRDVERYGLYGSRSRSLTLSVDEAEITGEQAFVEVRETIFYRSRLFFFEPTYYTNELQITLALREDRWEIIDADNYFPWCWRHAEGCR
jgi:hypothetical protein